MTHEEKAKIKIQQLASENQNLNAYVKNLNTEYGIITDQYMNGDIPWDVGSQQRKLKKAADKAERQIQKNNETIRKLRLKYEGGKETEQQLDEGMHLNVF